MLTMVLGLALDATAAERTYLAVCRDGRAELVASVGDGGIDPHLGQPWTAGPDPALVALADLLSTTRWYDAEGELAGTPFPAPFVRNHWNDQGTTAYLAAACEGELCGLQRLVLGPCLGGGQVWSTAPFIAGIAPEPVLDRVATGPARWLRLDSGETVALVPAAAANVTVEVVVVTRPDGVVEQTEVEIEGAGC